MENAIITSNKASNRLINMYKLITINEHINYLEMLKLLKCKTKYIEYVIVDEEDTRIADKFNQDIVLEKSVNKWWGTKTSQKCKLYRIKASNELFSYLKKFETFCIMKCNQWGDVAQYTDFGINDIAFFDDKNEPILYTTTHEGYIELRNDIKYSK